jgi:hypothetical protein
MLESYKMIKKDAGLIFDLHWKFDKHIYWYAKID